MANNILDELKLKYSTGNSATKLIYVNVVVFFTLLIVDFILKTVVKSSITTVEIFGLSSFNELITRPWQVLTYSWLHGNLFHLIMNMVLLYFVGQMFLRHFRDQNLYTFYIFGGIFGGIFFLLFQDVFNYSHLVGASASVYAVFFGLISYNPKMPVRLLLIPSSFPLLYVGYVFIAFDVYNIIADQNAGGSISHLGGAAFGYLYMKQFERGNDFLGKFINQIGGIFQKKEKSTFKTYKNTSSTQSQNVPKNDYDFNHQKVEKQKKIDTILDKISRSGYESLSKEEKDFLFKEGR